MASSDGQVQFFLTHLPHIIAPIIGLAFLIKFGLYMRKLPPAHLNDDELAAWHAAQEARKRQAE